MKQREDGTQIVGHKHKFVSATLTRPANTTQYAAGDQVAQATPAALNFADVGVYDLPAAARASGKIVSALCVDSAAHATPADLELWLFTAAPTISADNAALTVTDAQMLTLVGVIVFDAWFVGLPTQSAAGNSVSMGDFAGLDVPYAFECAANDRDLYGMVVERGTFTPISAEVFTFILGIQQD